MGTGHTHSAHILMKAHIIKLEKHFKKNSKTRYSVLEYTFKYQLSYEVELYTCIYILERNQEVKRILLSFILSSYCSSHNKAQIQPVVA